MIQFGTRFALIMLLTTAVVACTALPNPEATSFSSENSPTERLSLDERIRGQSFQATNTKTKPTSEPLPLAHNQTAETKTQPAIQATNAPIAIEPTPPIPETIAPEDAGWWLFTNGNNVRDLTAHNDLLYAATGGGLVQWDMSSGASRKHIIYDGLPSNDVLAVTVCPTGQLFAGTERGVGIYDPVSESWASWTTENSPLRENKVTAVLCNESGLFIGYAVRGADSVNLETDSWQLLGNTDTGLYSNAVRQILQAPDGAFWLNAGFGLSRIAPDGTITTWDEETGLPDDSIITMAVAPDETLWLGTIDGAIRYTQTGEWELFSRDNVTNMPIGLVRGVVPLADGRMWLGTSIGDLCLLDPTTRTCDETYADAHDTSLTSLLLQDDTLYWGTTEGIFRWQHGREPTLYILENQIITNEITAFAEDSQGYVWVGTDQGLIRTLPADIGGVQWTLFNRDNSELASDIVNDIAAEQGANGGIWVGSYRGASYYDGQRWFTLNEDNGLPDVIVRTLTTDALGQVWLGTDSGLGRWDGSSLTWLTTAVGLPADEIHALLYDATHNQVWVGTEDGLVAIDSITADITAVYTAASDDLEEKGVTALALANNGDLLIGNERILLRYAHDNQPMQSLGNLNSYFLTSIAVEPTTDHIWVGTTGDYLFYDNGVEMLQLTESVPSHQIQDILVDSMGTVWLAGNSYNEGGGGLGRFIPVESSTDE